MTLKRSTLFKAGCGVIGLGVLGFFVITSPWIWTLTHPGRTLPSLAGADLENGRTVFVASDCATCHATPGQDSDTVLGGGRELETAFGLFHMPNISPDNEHGIGGWTLAEFDRALREGVGPGGVFPDGRNLYPAFPYTSYQRLTGEDVRDLYAYMMTLPAQSDAIPDHELNFPFNIRRGVGVWRLAFLDGEVYAPGPVPDGVDADTYHRGAYLVEGAGHCAECHSPRGFMGNVLADARYGGGPNPEGTGWVPNISPDETGIGFWSQASLANYLHTGVNPIGRMAAGDMGEVIKNTAKLSFADVQAMALYLRHVDPVKHLAPGMPEPNYTEELVMLDNAVRVAAQLPVSAPDAFVADMPATVVETKNFWLDADGALGSDAEQGKLLGGAKVSVSARDGERVGFTLSGWQLQEAPSIVYQAKGRRVIAAVLSDAAAAAATRGAPELDPDTEQTWLPVELSFWSDGEGLNADRDAVWAYSGDTFQRACAACHVLPQKAHFTANQWIGVLKSMRRFTSFTDDEYRLILAYLQNHSKDLNEGGGGHQ